jgi:hypothetical protein
MQAELDGRASVRAIDRSCHRADPPRKAKPPFIEPAQLNCGV